VIDEEEGVRAVHEAFKRGINFFDTSPFYGGTKSETVRARANIRRRSRF
jgi:L-galactose dehydrogenase